MVFIKIKISEDDIFYYETKCEELIENAITEIVYIQNMRIKIRELIKQCKDLANYGIVKNKDMKMIKKEEEEEEEEEPKIEEVDDSNKKENNEIPGNRCGIPPKGESKKTLEKEISNLEDLLNAYKKGKKYYKFKEYEESIKLLQAAILICYPMNIPKSDPVSIILKENWVNIQFYNPKTSTIWFAGKQLFRDKKISSIKSVGKNERTTILCKLQYEGKGAPPREKVITPELQKKLMSYWYKKQEQQKKLLEDDDDSFLNSSWADNKALSKTFQGLQNIKTPF